MTEGFLNTYFEGLAIASRDIQHNVNGKAFAKIRNKWDLEEFDTAVRSMKSKVCLLLELGSGAISDDDHPMDSARIGLHILKKSTEVFADQEAARDDSKNILVKLLARIKYDRLEADLRPDNSDGPLRQAKIQFTGDGNFEDIETDGYWIGKSLYFDLRSNINLEYNPNDFTS